MQVQPDLVILPLVNVPARGSYIVHWSDGQTARHYEVLVAADNLCRLPVLDLKSDAFAVEFKKPQLANALFVCLYVVDSGGNHLAKAGNSGVPLATAANATVAPPLLAAINVSPSGSAVPLGTAQQFTAIGTYTDGATKNLSKGVTWSIRNLTGSATIDQSGLVSTGSGAQGEVTVLATLGALKNGATLTVAAPALTTIAIAAASSVPLGAAQQLTATGTYSDGSTLDLTNAVTWSAIKGTGLAAIDAKGLVRTSGGSQGSVTISASQGATTVSVVMTVLAPAVASIAITAGTTRLAVGSSRQYAAVATLTDGETLDYTSQVAWTKTDGTGSVTVNGAGLAIGTAAGTATIHGRFGVVQGDSALTVASYVLSTAAGELWTMVGLGGPATQAAGLQGTLSLGTDASGNLYAASLGHNTIYKIDALTGVITLAAGTGNKGFSSDGTLATSADLNLGGRLGSIAVDGSGNVYFSDSGGTMIRKIDASTARLATVAGNGTAGFSGDGGPATSAQLSGAYYVAADGAGNVYFEDQANYRVRKVAVATGRISTVAGTGVAGNTGDGGVAIGATILPDGGIAVSGTGDIFIASQNAFAVRKVAASGLISRVAGIGAFGFSGDGGAATSAAIGQINAISIDTAGNLYLAGANDARVRQVSAATGHITTVAGNGTSGFTGDGGPATSAGLSNIGNVAADGSGNFYINDSNHSRIRKVTTSTGKISTFGGGFGGLAGDGGIATSATLNAPSAIAADGSGNLYIVDAGNQLVRKITAATGYISIVAGNGTAGFGGDGGPATSAALYNPNTVAIDGGGNLYISDFNNNRIRKVAAATGIISTVVGDGTYGFGGDGGPALSAALETPAGIAFDPAGNLYIADSGNARIRMVSAATGVITTIAGNGSFVDSGDGGLAVNAGLPNPSSVAVDAGGTVYFADRFVPRIRKVTPATGLIATVAGTGLGGFSGDGGPAIGARISPGGVAVDADRNLYISDYANQRVRKVTAASGDILTIAGDGVGGFAGDGGPGPSGRFYGPTAVACDSAGRLYVADELNNLVRMLSP